MFAAVIEPSNFEPLVRGWLRDGLPDLSVSRQRSRLQWGIPVPGDDSQTVRLGLGSSHIALDGHQNYQSVIKNYFNLANQCPKYKSYLDNYVNVG